MKTLGLYKYCVLTWLLLALCQFNADAQVKRYSTYNFSIDDGLSQNSVNSIIKDNRGFIWFGTEDGLNRYDGNEVTIFSSKDERKVGLLNNSITCLLEDSINDLIYIGTNGGGLSILTQRTEQFEHFYYDGTENCISSGFIYDMCHSIGDKIAIASTYGVSLFDPSTSSFDNFVSGKDFPYVTATSIMADVDSVLWVGTYGKGLVRLNLKNREKTEFVNQSNSSQAYNSNIIEAIIQPDDIDLLWLATDSGFYEFNKVTGKYRLLYLENVKVSDVAIDCQRGVWIGSSECGLTYVSPSGEIEEFSNNPYDIHSLNTNYIRSLFIDERNHLWIGTKSSGCIHMNISDSQFVHYYQTKDGKGINGSSVYAVNQDEFGDVWIGTMKGLSVWQDNRLSTYHPFKDKREFSVWALHHDANDLLWLGTSRGLVKHNRQSKTNRIYEYNKSIANSLPDNEVYALERDAKGNLWVGTAWGLAKFDEQAESFEQYSFINRAGDYSNEIIWDIHSDSQDRLWVTSRYGVNLYQPETDTFRYIHAVKDAAVGSVSVMSVYEDSQNRIWLATSKGICLLNDSLNISKHYGLDEGLLSDYVYRILEYKNEIWVSTNEGISRIDFESGRVVNYDVNDGLQSNEFNSASELLDDGRFVFGGINGFNVFHPNKIVLSDYTPPIYFTSLELYGKAVNVRDTIENDDVVIRNSIIAANSLAFTPDERFFTLNFAALDYQNPLEIDYQYRMLPNSYEWIPLGNKRTLTFIDLSPGEYELQIRSTNAEGFLCSNVKSLSVVVNPPFWKYPWFIITCVLVIVLIVYLIGRLYYVRIKTDKEILEKRVAIRTKEFELQRNIANRQRDEIARQKTEIESFAKNLESIVDQRTHELKIAKEAAEESDRLKSAFLSNMSHEIRTPMNAIIGFSELLLESSFSNEEKEGFAGMIRTNGDNLLHLLNDIIDISMIESEQLKVSFTSVNITSLVKEVYGTFKTSKVLQDKENLIYRLICPDDSIVVMTDGIRLRQILGNLISNALKFTNKGFVKVELRRVGNQARFEVEDSGIGISDHYKPRIFERFLKIENANANLYGGNGIGLTITKNLVELLNGNIGLESEEGKGTLFYFTIPIDCQ